MSDDFEQAFGGGRGARPFTDRVGRADTSHQPTEQRIQPSEDGIYRAYGSLATGEIGETCDVQRWLDGTDTPEGIEFQYRFLMQIGYVGEEEIRLFLPDCIIVLAGKNLRDLRKKLARRQLSFIQQYSGRVWSERPSSKSPIVESIKVVRPDRADR
jgi:hypothetical protein